ncbi:hypothetical protein Tsubulata_044854 [Turnera subulata]|uniref:Trigger factor ribosome-binding bacterial domain-containing protein n=1 Tax=Turnera subulata TaxID=218843 RepID=A0A9Q0JFR6_9ROSI|nr:hypothetical protein Tsubulata_044854 [Turnera subulata]
MMRTITPPQLQLLANSNIEVQSCIRNNTATIKFSHHIQINNRLLPLFSSQSRVRVPRHVTKPISAVSSGMEASISDAKKKAPIIKNAKFVVVSQDEDKVQVRVDVNGDETEKAFSKLLRDLASSAPPVPGFRRQKGGIACSLFTTLIEKIAGLPISGTSNQFVFLGLMQLTTLAILTLYYFCMFIRSHPGKTTKENLKVKENKFQTIQKVEELKELFAPGNEFGFNAVLELEKPEASS